MTPPPTPDELKVLLEVLRHKKAILLKILNVVRELLQEEEEEQPVIVPGRTPK